MKNQLKKRAKIIVLLLLAAAFFLIAWNRDMIMLYAMFSMLAAVLVLGCVLPIRVLHGLEVKRTFPPSAFEDDDLNLDVTVENKGHRGRFMIEVVDNIPAAEPSLQNPMSFIAKISKGNVRSYSVPVHCYKRGEYEIGPITLRSAYPLGISETERVVPEERGKLIVYPRVFDVARFPLFSATNMPSSNSEAISKAGGTEDFFGTREYRRGDSIRYIHWPSTARHAKLIVKEFEMRSTSELTIILNLQKGASAGTGRESTFEYSVKIAASLAKFALERGHTVQIIGFAEKVHILPYCRGLHNLPQALTMLARVNDDGAVPYPRAIAMSADYLRDGGQAIMFFSSGAKLGDYVYALGLLKAKRIRPAGIFMDDDSFRTQAGVRPLFDSSDIVQELIIGSCPVYRISKGDNLSEAFA